MNTSYKRSFEDGTISIPILSLTAESDDEAPIEDMKEWQKYTTGKFDCHLFKGDHFFAFEDNGDFMSFLLNYIRTIR